MESLWTGDNIQHLQHDVRMNGNTEDRQEYTAFTA